MRRVALVCVVLYGCDSPAEDPAVDAPADASMPMCTAETGDFHDVAFTSGGETRHYFLHVPRSFDCTAWPLVVDFHGTGAGGANDPVEESWAFDEMLEASDSEHFIVVRPRSRSKVLNGTNIFQWDINPGDVAKNLEFATSLIADLKSRYMVDPQRVYAAGFSNGPSQALQFLAVEPPLVHGYMIVSGGLNQPLTRATPLPADAGRIYVTVGFRDYMWPTTRMLRDFLDAHGYPADHLWQRASNTGHELYGWHYHEAFAWLDRGTRPAAGMLGSGWTRDPGFSGDESLITIARDPAGRINVAGEGAIYRRASSGTWTRTAQLASGSIPLHFNGLCFLDDGTGIAVGEGSVYRSTDGASWTAGAAVPEFGAQNFGRSYLNGLACAGQTVVAGGVWSAATSVDGGSLWSASSMDSAFVTTVRRAPNGTWISAGYYDYVGRSTDGVTFEQMGLPVSVQWINDAENAGGTSWWAVGEKGTLLHSADDGRTWTSSSVPTTEDLYAVAFASPTKGMAVGAHGVALVTTDGTTWTLAPTGLDGYLGAVTWLDGTTALVVGEAGTVVTYASP